MKTLKTTVHKSGATHHLKKNYMHRILSVTKQYQNDIIQIYMIIDN
jgi:hypothetical protein